MKQNVLFIIHRIYSDGVTKEGGIDSFIRYFRAKKDNIVIIEHPLEDFSYPSKLIYDNKTQKEFVIKNSPPARWIKEIFANNEIAKKLNHKFLYGFASDPLNFVALYWLKRKKIVKQIVFHCTDYSDKRFKNKILNSFYHRIFNFSLKHADQINVVSPYVFNKVKKIMPDSNLNLVPNSPIFNEIKKIDPDKKDKNKLVISVGKTAEQIDWDKMFLALQIVKKTIPNIHLTMIGNSNEMIENMINKFSLNKNISITGLLPYEKAIDEVSNSYLGIVWYSDKVDHVKYGDSIKIREYAAAGLPILADNITSTAQEMKKFDAGFIINTPEELAERVVALIKDKKVYDETRNHALLWAQKMDKQKILEKIFK